MANETEEIDKHFTTNSPVLSLREMARHRSNRVGTRGSKRRRRAAMRHRKYNASFTLNKKGNPEKSGNRARPGKRGPRKKHNGGGRKGQQQKGKRMSRALPFRGNIAHARAPTSRARRTINHSKSARLLLRATGTARSAAQQEKAAEEIKKHKEAQCQSFIGRVNMPPSFIAIVLISLIVVPVSATPGIAATCPEVVCCELASTLECVPMLNMNTVSIDHPVWLDPPDLSYKCPVDFG